MQEAILYERLTSGNVECNVCQWRCKIAPDHYGVCKTRLNRDGKLYTLIYSEISSVAVDPVEKKPLFHFHPGTQVFSLGTWGCNFHCRHCQNWQISYAEHGEAGWIVEGSRLSSRTLSPEECIELTKHYDCSGIAWTYNEPGIWLEYTIDGAKLAKENNLYTAYVTNGFLTPEALDEIGPYLDAYRVDIKGFGDHAYHSLANIPKGSWRGILDVAERAKSRWGMHVEVVTNVVPGFNDDDEQIKDIAQWIKRSLGADTPWHITRFYPQAEMRNVAPTPIETLQRAHKIGREAGLDFVYLGNVSGGDGENTYCPGCAELVIQRIGYRMHVVAMDSSGRCSNCGSELNIRLAPSQKEGWKHVGRAG